MLDLDQKADEDLSRQTHCVMGCPSLLRTKARPKNLSLYLQKMILWNSFDRRFPKSNLRIDLTRQKEDDVLLVGAPD